MDSMMCTPVESNEKYCSMFDEYCLYSKFLISCGNFSPVIPQGLITVHCGNIASKNDVAKINYQTTKKHNAVWKSSCYNIKMHGFLQVYTFPL